MVYALPQLLAIYCGEQVKSMLLTPWRKEKQVTAGYVRLGFQSILRNVRIRDRWHPKCRKFQPDFDAEGHCYEAVVRVFPLLYLVILTEFCYRPNRRLDLPTMADRIAYVALRTQPVLK